jgi:hypothetical protein
MDALSLKAQEEISKAEDKVRCCEDELDKAEDKLHEILTKYRRDTPKDEDISESLPSLAVMSGMRLLVLNDKKITVLRNINGDELKRWSYPPSLTELLNICDDLVKV